MSWPSGQTKLPPRVVREARLLGAGRELVAELADLRVAAQRIEARQHEAQLAVEPLDEGRSRARGRIDGRGIFLQDELEVGIKVRDIGLDRAGAGGDQAVGELEALGVRLAQAAPRAVARAAIGAGAARRALGLGLLGRDRGERGEGVLQQLKPALPGLQRALHLENRGSGRLRRLRPRLQETPVEAEGEGHRYQDQHDIAGNIKRIEQEPELAGEHRVQSIDDHALQHEHGKADGDHGRGADLARACLDKLQHAGIGGDPRECAKPREQKIISGE